MVNGSYYSQPYSNKRQEICRLPSLTMEGEVDIMQTFTYVITDEIGIHARPAGALAKKAKEGASKVTLSVNGKSAEASRLMAVMSLGVKKGMEVTVTVEGEDEEQVAGQMEQFFKENL